MCWAVPKTVLACTDLQGNRWNAARRKSNGALEECKMLQGYSGMDRASWLVMFKGQNGCKTNKGMAHHYFRNKQFHAILKEVEKVRTT